MKLGKNYNSWALSLLLLVFLSLSLQGASFKQRTSTSSGSHSSSLSMHRYNEVKLPEKLIVGYANWNQCDDSIVRAVEQGVNVVMWFAINLVADPETGKPAITNGPDMDCVADIMMKIRALGDEYLDTVHLISIGGWNAPHVDSSNSAEDVYEFFHFWNRNIAASPEKGFYGFHGFDWDIEGNDDPQSPNNHFSCACLDSMGAISQLAKARDNYIVTMAPAESYVDPTCGGFDRSLLHEYAEWLPVVGSFAYHGRNAYAYLLSRYGKFNRSLLQRNRSSGISSIGSSSSSSSSGCIGDSGSSSIDDSSGCKSVDERKEAELEETFDFVTVQLYEGYSHALYNITQQQEPAERYLQRWVQSLLMGWWVDFRTDAALNYPHQQLLQLPAQRLVVGLANGWAGDGKFLLIYPDQVERGYAALSAVGSAPRGFAFWNIKDEGISSPQRPDEPLWMAAGLNTFMHTRRSSSRSSSSSSNSGSSNNNNSSNSGSSGGRSEPTVTAEAEKP